MTNDNQAPMSAEQIANLRTIAEQSIAVGEMSLSLNRDSTMGQHAAWWKFLGVSREVSFLRLLDQIDTLRQRAEAAERERDAKGNMLRKTMDNNAALREKLTAAEADRDVLRQALDETGQAYHDEAGHDEDYEDCDNAVCFHARAIDAALAPSTGTPGATEGWT